MRNLVSVFEKQETFELSLKIECPFCKKQISVGAIKPHLYTHKLNNYEIEELKILEISQRVCPLCDKAFRRPLKGHFRKMHFSRLNKFANGIYETEHTILKRKQDQQIKNEVNAKIRFRKLFVQGGLPSLGKKSK